MFKIGEFSKITQVSVRMLRYYDEQKLLVPCYVDEFTGYRLYSAKQIDALNRIVLLRDMGFGIKEMKEMLEAWNPELIRKSLQEQQVKTQEMLQTQQSRLLQIQGMLRDLENQDKKLDIEIIMKQLPMQHVVSLRRIVQNYYCEGDLWKELGEHLQGVMNADTLPCFSIYHDLDYREENVDIEVCVATPKIETAVMNNNMIFRQVEAVPMAASFMIYGPYSNISRAYQEFALWMERHPEYCMAGENRQICHVAMNSTDNPEELITELQIPLTYTQQK